MSDVPVWWKTFNQSAPPLTYDRFQSLVKAMASAEPPELHRHLVSVNFWKDKRRRYSRCVECGEPVDKYPGRKSR